VVYGRERVGLRRERSGIGLILKLWGGEDPVLPLWMRVFYRWVKGKKRSE